MKKLLSCVLAVAGCSSESSPPIAPPPAPTYYHRDAKAIIDAKCTPCHQTGGIAPFPLTTYEEAAPRAYHIGSAVASRTMPPWPPDGACNTYHGDRSLSPAQMETLLAWVDGGALPGDVAATGEPIPPSGGGLSRIDVELPMPEPYTPRVRPDENRCFLIDWPESATKYITGFRAIPGEPSIVHHAILFLAEPSEVAAYVALDAMDADAGWPCYGGTGLTARPHWLGGWVPGSEGADYPAGTGLRVEPGSKLIVQMHYNTSTIEPRVDQTVVALSVADSVALEAVIIPFLNPGWALQRNMHIPAGERDVKHRFEIDPTPQLESLSGGAVARGPYRLYMSALHMHTRGTRARVEVMRAAGDTCVLDIPRWDFHWQSVYRLREPIDVEPGDRLAVECHFDNSAPGAVDMNWGESTEEEMCLATLYITSRPE